MRQRMYPVTLSQCRLVWAALSRGLPEQQPLAVMFEHACVEQPASKNFVSVFNTWTLHLYVAVRVCCHAVGLRLPGPHLWCRTDWRPLATREGTHQQRTDPGIPGRAGCRQQFHCRLALQK